MSWILSAEEIRSEDRDRVGGKGFALSQLASSGFQIPGTICITSDGYVVMGSETGVLELQESLIVEKGRLGPGQMLAVDLETHRLLHNWEVKEEASARLPYAAWLEEQVERPALTSEVTARVTYPAPVSGTAREEHAGG